MSVYHCPLCPLIFEYRTEVEWHLREQHRSRSDEEAELRAELTAATGTLDWGQLEDLRSATSIPSVSLLLATTPAPVMTVLDVARLRQLADRARRRLAAEPDRHAPTSVLEYRVSKAVAAAEGLATDRGVAILVSHDHLAIIGLPFEPRDRAVVDQAFATRDLEYTLRRYPPYRVLVLGHNPQILEARGGRLFETDGCRTEGRRQRYGVARSSSNERDPDRLLDQRVGVAGNLPLVLIGERRRLADFRQHSSYAPTIFAEIQRPRTRRTGLAELAQQAVAKWHRDQQDDTVADLERDEARHQITWGVAATWQAIKSKAADQLWVEHDFARPGRIVAGVEGVEVTHDPAEPGAIDDLVDNLITTASRNGILVHLLDNGTLDRPEPIAARIRGTGESAPDDASPGRSLEDSLAPGTF